MADLKLSSAALLSLLQWCDSFFPSGAFSHSFGLESAVQSEKVSNGKDLSRWIETKLIHQVIPCDLILLGKSYEAGLSNNLLHVQTLDATGHAMRFPREVREGGRMIALRFIETAAELYPTDWTIACKNLISKGPLKGDPAVAFGIVGFAANIPLQATRFGYLYIFISGQVSAALRLLPIGQHEGQKIIRTLLNWVEKRDEMSDSVNLSDRKPSAFMPASEIRSMQHERLEVRLFQS